MSSLSIQIVTFALVVVFVGAAPTSMFEDIFPGFLSNTNLNAPSKEADVVKRQFLERNPDESLKQVSLQSLIGGLEHSLFQSALSVSGVVHDKNAAVQEITPASVTEHSLSKRHTPAVITESASISTTASPSTSDKPLDISVGDITTEIAPEGKNVVLQTSQNVPSQDGVPAHILIDRITVQPHFGGVPLIPAFQIQNTKLASSSNSNAADKTEENDHENGSAADSSKITITHTTIKATAITASNADTVQKVSSITSNSSTVSGSSTEQPISSTTTKEPLKELKEKEEKLKEKVAEIEAEPVLFSARV